MNIHELDSYNLGDAVKFNDKLNPRLWDDNEQLRPEVREQLLRIADDFREFLGIDVDVDDITISGSNAAYTYTPHSDIDLHLVVDLPEADANEVYRELFDAKKYAYNDQHNIKIGGYDVELYVQDARKPHHSQGIYSVKNNDWVSVPRRRKPDVNDISVQSKFEDLGHRIEAAIDSGDYENISAMANKVKEYRQAGLDQHGEFGPENLAFKILRSQGLIQKLYDARAAAKDQDLSLDERKKKKKKKVRYGYGGYWYPGTAYAGQDQPAGTEGGGDGGGGGESVREDVGMTWDGVDPTTDMFASEDVGMTPSGVSPTTTMFTSESGNKSDEQILKDFVQFCVDQLNIQRMPRVKLRRDPEWCRRNRTFGRYNDEQEMLEVAWGNRHIMDVLRTVAHELTHKHQHERETVPSDAGETGSRYENEANAQAGVIMRNWAQQHPEHFGAGSDNIEEQLDENLKSSAGTVAVLTCLLAGGGLSGCATAPQQNTQQILRTTQDVGRTVQTARNITRAGTEAEVQQEIRTLARVLGGRTEEANNSNIIRIWKKLKGQPPVQAEPEVPEYGPAMPVRRIPQNESASGYIPTKKQARDPRYSMALTVDIKPGQVGKEANKLKLRTDKQGHPQIAKPSGLVEALALEFARFKTGEDYSPDNPPGPESKPTMPAGTVRVDVSDVYDWYKLGQHISNLKGLGKHDFGKGPPSSIISFGDEETEHKFINNLKKTGLDVTDIDPVDPKQPAGIKKVKTDPTYNVDEDLTEDQQLDEVKMSPGALMQWANSDAAKGIRSGFEAELIFRDTVNDGDDDEMEPDYDMDERCRSIDQVVEFFQDDEWGYGLSERQASRLRDNLDEQYMEWMDGEMYNQWRDERDELIKEAWLREKPMAERVHDFLVDGMDLSDQEADRIQAAGDAAPRFTKSSDQEAYKQANPDYATYLEAEEGAEEILQEDVEQTIEKEDGFYDEVLDDFRSDFYVDDDSGFFDDVGLRYMSDVANSYDLGWPYLTGGGGNGGSREWESIGDSLNSAIDMPVKVSSGYHSTPRKEGMWIVEPDSSLEPDDREDFGLEIVSPPMPLEQALQKLQEVTDWANNPSEGNAYTNGSTGLHMGVSVPFKGGDVDYLKLILFLGDEYVLKSFGREANTYTKSAMSKFKENIKGGRADPAGAMKLMQSNLIEFAYREIQKGVGEGKYTSAHIQKGYIEFRSAGGDWLAEGDAEPGKLENTMLRYAYAMSLAADPSAERREYAKKLYKLIAPEGDSQLALFSQFASGELDAEQLKKRWAEKTIGTEKKMNQRWKLYQNVDGRWEPVPGGEWNGYTEEQVKNAVWSKYGREALDSGEYQLVNMGEQDWEVYDVKTGKTLEIVKGKSKGEVADAVYDKYVDQGIGFQVRPYEDPATMTPRAKLAKSIVSKPTGPEVYTYYKWNVANPKTGENSTDYMTRERVFQTTKQVEKENPKAGKYINTIVGGGSAQLTTSRHPRDIDDMTFDFRAKGSNEVIERQTYNPENAEKWQARPVVAAIERANKLSEKLGKPVIAYEVTPKQEPEQTVDNYRGKWEFFYAPTGRVLDAVNDASIMQARAVLADTQRRYDDLPADQIQMRKAGAVQDVEPDVAQNFAPDYSAFERNSDRIDAIRARANQSGQPQDATDVPRNWEFVNRINGQVIHTMTNASYNQANVVQTNLELRYPDADIFLRSVERPN